MSNVQKRATFVSYYVYLLYGFCSTNSSVFIISKYFRVVFVIISHCNVHKMKMANLFTKVAVMCRYLGSRWRDLIFINLLQAKWIKN